MTKDYLLEIGMEEIPARFLTDLRDQLKDKVEEFLTENRLSFIETKAYATPRRLAVMVKGLASKQEDITESVKGPALRIAKDDSGEWTKAAQGFVRGQELTTDDIVIKNIKDEDYIFVDKFLEGEEAESVLTKMDEVLNSLSFPVSMTWHTYHKNFIRPIHWIVSLLDDKVVPFNFINVQASNVSFGHRFLGNETNITSVHTYIDQLRNEYVIVDFDERQQMIINQINQIAEENNWNIPITEDLIDEVTSIVEWPTAFFGDFEEKYLEIPQIILITAMRDHQRYFYALDKKTNQLQPFFISVRNGDSKHIENVIKGNKKVLKARLEDALFFYNEDMTHDLDFFVNKLSAVKEHYKLGSYLDKQERVQVIVKKLADTVGEEAAGDIAYEAAKIYKFDLMTQIVNEFAELQGYMGEIYAKKFGVDEEVAAAIGEQYLPTSSGGELPNTKAGALLAFADKLDTLLNYFSFGLIPTGSNDPYALRRQTMGLVEINQKFGWDFDIQQFVTKVVRSIGLKEVKIINQFIQFFKLRFQQFLERQDIDYDIIQADIKGHEANIVSSMRLVKDMQILKKNSPEEYRALVESLTRVVNLGAKSEVDGTIDESMAQTESERNLMHIILSEFTNPSFSDLERFRHLTRPIEEYFENNMVNDEDMKIRKNRLATMKYITEQILKLIDPRELNSKF
ncbi:glycine--tRNA ligase subunit beta [Aerococcaceae bacterium WGS1372]